MRRLYRPDKYGVIVGNGQDGLCTAWNNPELLVSSNPGILERFGIIGTLYSVEGVSIILRNLALNPDIRRIYLWRRGKLSNTSHGRKGWEALKRTWEGDFSHLDAGIDTDIAELITQNVEIVDVSDTNMENLASLPPGLSEPYMEPVEFGEPEYSPEEPFLSEGVGFVVRERSLVDAWTKAVDRIMRYGRVKGTEYGQRQKELSALMWIFSERIEEFSEPEWDSRLLKKTSLDGWKEYAELMTSPEKPEGLAYTYGNRLREFFGVDQLEWVSKKLSENPETRRAVCTTYYPPVDEQSKSPPCLIFIQFLERSGKLDMFASFRSHDIFKAALSNALGLMQIHRMVSEKAGMERGSVAITSYSAHIYESDWNDAERLSKCMFEGRIKPFFDEKTDADPRGNVIIRIAGNEIIAELVAGKKRLEISGKSAKEVAYKIARLDILSLPMHYADIGMELQKAEIAMRNGIEYVQDRPLMFDFNS